MRIYSIIITFAALLIISCTNRKFNKIEIGMPINQLIEIVGEPDSIVDNYFNETWFYPTHIISINDSAVALIQSKSKLKAEIQEMQKDIQQIKKLQSNE